MSVSVAASKSASGDKKRPPLVIDAPVVRILRDELLFRPGQRKTHLYLIEAGSVVSIIAQNSLFSFSDRQLFLRRRAD